VYESGKLLTNNDDVGVLKKVTIICRYLSHQGSISLKFGEDENTKNYI